MDSSTCSNNVSAEEVIAKLKDEGDFDKLRLKIVRKLKEKEELRSNIASIVKQSAALNREGAETLKPRQLADAIHEEVGSEVMSQISDALWGVIRSSDDMRSEISETVESVYNRLLNPKGKQVNVSSSPKNPAPSDKEPSNNNVAVITVREREDTVSDNEPKEPPGFHQQASNSQWDHKEEAHPPTSHDKKIEDEIEAHNPQHTSPSNNDSGIPPGFSASVDTRRTGNAIDEDPDVPPGFG